MDRRERIIEVSNKIADLRKELHNLEAELDALIEMQPVTAALLVGATQQASGMSAESQSTIAYRILQVLNREQAKDFDSREMLHRLELPEDRLPTVRSTLHRLYGEERIARHSPGRFSARQTQPDAGRAENPNEGHGEKNAAA